MDLGKNLKETRLSRRMTRAAVVEKYRQVFDEAMHPQTLVKLESGRMNVTGEWLNKLAKVYDASPEAIAVGDTADKFVGVVRVPVLPAAALLRGEQPDDSDFVMVSDHDVPGSQSAALGAVRLGDAVIVFDTQDTEPEPRSTYVIERGGLLERREYRTNPERWEAPGADVFAPAGATVPVFGRVLLTILRQPRWRA